MSVAGVIATRRAFLVPVEDLDTSEPRRYFDGRVPCDLAAAVAYVAANPPAPYEPPAPLEDPDAPPTAAAPASVDLDAFFASLSP